MTALAILGSGCGGGNNEGPAVTVPTQPAPSASASSSAPPVVATMPSKAPTAPWLQDATCTVAGAIDWLPLRLRLHGKLFVSQTTSAEWLELRLARGRADATLSGRALDFDFGGEVALGDVTLTTQQRALEGGWIVPEELAIRDVGDGEITGLATLPRVVLPASNAFAKGAKIEVKQRCDALIVGKPAWTRTSRGPTRVLKRGAKADLRDAKGPNARVLARIEVPPASASNVGRAMDTDLFTATVLEQSGNDVKLAIFETGAATVEGWTQASVLLPANDRDAQARLLAHQADEMQSMMLAVLGGGVNGSGKAPGPPQETCARAVTIFVRDESGTRIAVGSFHPNVALPLANAAAGAELPVDLVRVPAGSTPPPAETASPFVLASQVEQCKSGAASPSDVLVSAVKGRGLVVGQAPSANAAQAAPARAPATLRESNSADPPASATAGPERAVATLRPKIKACYDVGRKADPAIRGKLTLTIKIDASGRVTNADVTQNTGLPAAVASCVQQAAKQATFPPPEQGQPTSTLVLPINLVPPP